MSNDNPDHAQRMFEYAVRRATPHLAKVVLGTRTSIYTSDVMDNSLTAQSASWKINMYHGDTLWTTCAAIDLPRVTL